MQENARRLDEDTEQVPDRWTPGLRCFLHVFRELHVRLRALLQLAGDLHADRLL